jgi:hypothetical protein
MREYFTLQWKRINRKLIDFGLPLLIAYIIIPLAFYFLTKYIFERITYANYLYLLPGIIINLYLGESRRIDFLKSLFSSRDYLKIRAIENLVGVLPFFIFLLYKSNFVEGSVLLIISVLSVGVDSKTNFNFSIPTPFSKRPFEYIVGFRKTYLIFPLIYLVTYFSVKANNYNLGVFSLALVCLICLNFYSKPEEKYLVWNFALTSKEFLTKKTKEGIINFTLLSMPILLLLGVNFTGNLLLLLIIYLICYANVASMIFAKYSIYPSEMSLPEGILIGISIIFPPLLIVTIPFFYSKSIQQLNTILK